MLKVHRPNIASGSPPVPDGIWLIDRTRYLHPIAAVITPGDQPLPL